MSESKLPEASAEGQQRPAAINWSVQAWLNQFTAFFEQHFLDVASRLGESPTIDQLRVASSEAVVEVLIESGMTEEEARRLFDEWPIVEERLPHWNEDSNRRRFELIDRELQGDITSEERQELRALTTAMRRQIDTEAAFSLEGALKLHRLLMDSEDV